MTTQEPQPPQPSQQQRPDVPVDVDRSIAELDSELTRLAADPQVVREWWRGQVDRVNGNEGRMRAPYGPGGPIDVVETPTPGGGTAFRVVRRYSVTTPTAQADRAEQWLFDEVGFTVVDRDHDPRIGVTRLGLTGGDDATASERLLAALRKLRYDVPVGGERLSIGPDDITMEGMHAKAAGGMKPRPAPLPLGPRPTDSRGAGVTVAVIDGGFERDDKRRTDHWMDNVVPPEDATLDTDGDGELDDGAGHGTFVTGALLQVAPAATVRQYRALDSWGMGNTWRLKDCLLAAAGDGAQIINLSLGFDDVDLLGSPGLSAALTALPPDTLVVAAAGNSGSPVPSLPAAHSRCIGVGALKLVPGATPPRHVVPCVWSSFGPWVEFSCVGLGVVSTFVEEVPKTGTDPVRLWAGTSFAAPQISGLLAVELGRGKSPGEAVVAVHQRAQAQTGPPHPDFGHLLRAL